MVARSAAASLEVIPISSSPASSRRPRQTAAPAVVSKETPAGRPVPNAALGVDDSSVRERMLEIAATLMSQQGYAGTSVSDIVGSVGVGPPTLYWHFKNKRGILAAVMERGARRWMQGLPGPDALVGRTPRERYLFACDAATNGLQRESEFLRLLIMLSLERGADDDCVRATIIDTRERARTWQIEIMQACWPTLWRNHAAELALAQMAFADGLMIHREVEQNVPFQSLPGLNDFIADRAEKLALTRSSGGRQTG